MIDISIHLIIWLMLIVLMFLLGFSIYLIWSRTGEVSHQRKTEEYVKENQDAWYHYLINDKPFSKALIPKDKYELYGVEQIFLSYIKNTSDSAILEKIRRFSNESMKTHYEKLLNSRKWSIRMNALYRILDFHIDSLIDQCIQLESKKLSSDEQFQLLKIYLIFKPDLFLSEFLENPPSFSEYECKKLFKNADNSVVEQLIKDFSSLSTASKYALISVLGMKRDVHFVPFLENLLKEEDSELRIRSLKAIHEIGMINQPEPYIPFISSEIWEERLMAAKVLGNLPLHDSVPYLEELLADDEWWVRHQAAKTINNQPQTI